VRIAWELNAIFQELANCHAIDEEPYADLVGVPLLACVVAKVYLEFPWLIRDLARLQMIAMLRWYQEEARSASISCMSWDSYYACTGVLSTQTFLVCHLVQP
jgi:hypothetical protein